MANRKVLIESILGLAQKIGANPSKFMGTKGNVSFLGTGDRAMKGTTFSGELNKNFLELGVTKDDLIKVIEMNLFLIEFIKNYLKMSLLKFTKIYLK